MTRHVRKLLIAAALLLCSLSVDMAAYAAASAPTREARTALLETYLASHWPVLKERLGNLAKAQNPTALYDLQLNSNLLLDWAIETGHSQVVDELLELYMLPLARLEESKEITYQGAGRALERVPSSRAFRAWFSPGDRQEPVLNISQFLYVVARALNAPKAPLSAVQTYASVLGDHYTRWVSGLDGDPSRGVFTRIGWGCRPPQPNQAETVSLLLKNGFTGKVAHCNAVTDFELWIIAGVVEFLALDRKSPTVTGLSEAERSKLLEYARNGTELIRARSSRTAVNVLGKAEAGLLFDQGVWREHETYRYAGVTSISYPDSGSLTGHPVPQTIAYDISHARRFVQVFETLYRNRGITGNAFPSESDMRALANQLSFGVFNGDYRFPRFTNFTDGSNGWFRIGYAGRKGFGYGPFAMSNEWIAGGYCRLERYQPAMRKICDGVLETLRSRDSQVIDHRESKLRRCEHANFVEQRCPELDLGSPSFYVLNFLSSLRD